jgi:ABC-type uncharacterized transport system involved in gliding motility auxiliary subunit
MKSVISALGWLGVVLVVVAVIIRFSRPDLPQVSQGLAWSGLVVILLYALTQWRDIARAFSGRDARYGSIAASSVVVLLAILVGVNWVANRQNKRWDLTEANQFSLSEQTVRILRSLDQPVRIRVFYAGSPLEYQDRLAEYAYHSNQVEVEYVNAESEPLQAQSAGITSVPTFVIEYAGRTERATSSEEQALTNALKRVIDGQAKKIYFTQGHGEADPRSGEATGYSSIISSLGSDNFEVDTITLAQAGSVPEDATILAVAGPETDFLPGELDAVRSYLRRGGKLLLMLDPPGRDAGGDVTGLISLAREWGIEVGNNVLIDASGLGQLLGTDASVPVAMPVPHPITRDFRVMTAFPLARSVTAIQGGVDGRVAETVLETSPQAWAESDIAGLYATGRPVQDEGTDIPGPVTLAAAVAAAAEQPLSASESESDDSSDDATDAPTPETRIVVIGDSDFAANRAVGLQGNRDLFLNIASWLAQQEDLIAIRPADPQSRPIAMTASQGRWVFWFTLAIVPLLLFANAIRLYLRRRG